MPIVTLHFLVPDSELEFSVARSSGPGGQNVNKVNSKVILRWNLRTSAAVPEMLRPRLLSRLENRLTREGDLIVTSEQHRDQPRNRQDCEDKLAEILSEASRAPKIRRDTKPTYGSKKRKRKGKESQSAKKALRGKVR